MRNRGIDLSKGIVIAAMVLCHMLQFFGNTSLYPEQSAIMLVINALAFSTFTFMYGQSVFLAYLSKDFKSAWPRMLKSIGRGYGAFVVSGVANQIICNGRKFSMSTITNVALLKAIPGWSEFLISFALFGLIVLVLFPAFKALLEHKAIFWCVWALTFAAVLVPYYNINSVLLSLFIGGTKYCYFPVLQYMPFLLLGMYVARYGTPKPLVWCASGLCMTAAGVVYIILKGEPSRFPPSLMWILLPWAGIALLYYAGCALDGLGKRNRVCSALLTPVEAMGRNSLLFLLASNIAIFTASHTGLLPEYRKSASFPFDMSTGSTPWAILWTVVLLLAIGFMATLSKPRRKPQPATAPQSGD